MTRRTRKSLAAAALASSLLLAAGPALADEYDSESAGHPLRIAAYALHPVGYILELLIFRPAHWLVHIESFKALFGHED
jgi:hypothetical protein